MKKFFLLILMTTPFLTFAQSKRAFKKNVKEFRKHYKQEFLDEARSPFYNNKKGMDDMRFYKAKRKYKLSATFKRTPEAIPFKMSTYSGNTQDYILFGIATVYINTKKVPVHIYQSLRLKELEEYKDHLFIPFNVGSLISCFYKCTYLKALIYRCFFSGNLSIYEEVYQSTSDLFRRCICLEYTYVFCSCDK